MVLVRNSDSASAEAEGGMVEQVKKREAVVRE